MRLTRRPVDLLLWIGLVAGIVLVLVQLMHVPEEQAAAGEETRAAATVNGVAIPRHKYFAALASLATQKRAPRIDTAARQRILEQMIAEELLLARALELGLPRTEPVARRRLVTAMVEHVTAEVEQAPPPGEARQRRYYEAHPELFPVTARYVARRVLFSGGGERSRARARRAHERLRGGADFAAVSKQGDEPMMPLPAGPLPATALRQYLGPTAARTVTELSPGGYSQPVKGADGYAIVLLVRKVQSPRPPFARVRQTVAAMMLRRQRSEALNRYLLKLKRTAAITMDRAIVREDTPIPSKYLKQASGGKAESR